MHLGGDAARRGPRLPVMRPEVMLGMVFGEIFEDGEAVPNDTGSRLERRHFA
jgi:hypothetical protein